MSAQPLLPQRRIGREAQLHRRGPRRRPVPPCRSPPSCKESPGAVGERINLWRRGPWLLLLREQEGALPPEGRQLHSPTGERQLEGAGGVSASATEAVAGAPTSRTAGRSNSILSLEIKELTSFHVKHLIFGKVQKKIYQIAKAAT